MASQPTGPSAFGPSSQNDQFGAPIDAAQKKKGCGWGSCLIGCVGILLLSFVVCGGAGYYLYVKLPDIARSTINQVIDQSPMSPDDKKIVSEQVDRVVNDYKSGKIDAQQVVTVLQKLAESPLFTLLMVYAAEEKYLKPSMLPDDEKAAAKITLQRVARGFFEKKISEDELQPLLDHISTKKGNNQREFKDKLSDAELRAFLADCKMSADSAEIPVEPFEVKIGDEFKKAIDEALSPAGPPPPTVEIENTVPVEKEKE